jgi:hypothetical protein
MDEFALYDAVLAYWENKTEAEAVAVLQFFAVTWKTFW